MRPEGLLGTSLDWLVIDEAAKMKAEVWREYLTQRLTDRDGWVLIASTPADEGDWFHEEYQRAGDGDGAYECWSMPSWTNPAIDRAVIEAEAERLSEREYYSQYAAEFVPESGRICSSCGSGSEYNPRMICEDEWQKMHDVS